MPKNTTRKKARTHIAKKTKIITGVKIIQNDEDYEREVNRLKQLSRKAQFKLSVHRNKYIQNSKKCYNTF